MVMDSDQWSRRIERELAEAVVRITHFPSHKEISKEIREGDFLTLQEVSGQIQGMRADLREYVRQQVAEASLRYEKLLSDAESRLIRAIHEGNQRQQQSGSLIFRYGPFAIAMVGLLLAVASGDPAWIKLAT